MGYTIEELAAKMDALDLWTNLVSHNWAVKPRGSAFPYFCSAMTDGVGPVKARFLMLEGWQTFHDYVHIRMDRFYGFCSAPIELPHYELVMLNNGGGAKLFRHDAGYLPAEASPVQRKFVEKILWEALGFMLRFETDRQLPMKYFDDGAIFSRVEVSEGTWQDAPLPFLPARPHVEKVAFPKELVKKAVDLPLVANEVIDLDFRLLMNVITREPRPRCVYALVGVDATGKKLFERRVSMHPEGGLRGLWESMPTSVMEELVILGHVPGELRLCSGRVFRLLRPMCVELPVKLTMKASLPAIEAACRE